MELELLLSFLGASVLLSLMPGPDNIFVLTESITKGKSNGFAISLGLMLGVMIHTLAAATGLSIIIQQSEVIFSVIKYLGAAYLLYLAFVSFKEKEPILNFNTDERDKTVKIFPLLQKGFLMNILNPKVSLFFIAFLPQFISKNGFNITLQMIILGIIFIAQGIIVFGLVVVLSSKLTKYVNNPKFWKTTKWSKVIILSVLAITLAFSSK